MWNAKFLLSGKLAWMRFARGAAGDKMASEWRGSAQIFPHSSIDCKLGKSGIFLASSDLDCANGIPVAA